MNVKQYAFVTAYLKHRDAIIAYKLATGSESTNLRSLQSAANRMLNKPGVREEIESVLKATRAEVEAEIAETTRTELMTIHRKREILAQIINGTYTVMVRAKGKNCNPCTYFNSPTISQVLAGIREDNKMAGHYAVVTTTRGKLQQITTTPINNSPFELSEAVSRADASNPGRQEGCPLAFTPTEGRGPDTALPAEAFSAAEAPAKEAAKEGELQQSATTTESPSSAALPAEATAKEGELQQISTQSCPSLPAVATAKEGEMQQISTQSCPALPAVATAKEGELQQSATTTESPSSAALPAVATAKEGEMQHSATTPHNALPGIYPASGGRGTGRPSRLPQPKVVGRKTNCNN